MRCSAQDRRLRPSHHSRREIPAHARCQARGSARSSSRTEVPRHAARQSRRQIRADPSRCWRSRPRSAARRCADAGSASCWRTPPETARCMPLTLGPTQPDSVTTVATRVATSDARSGMSYQRRVISGILTCRKRFSSGMQIANATILTARPPASDQCTVRDQAASTIQTAAAPAQLTSACGAAPAAHRSGRERWSRR